VLLRGPFIATVRAILDGRLEEALAAATNLRDRADELGSAAFGRRWSIQLTLRPSMYLARAQEFWHGLSGLPGRPPVDPYGVLCLAHLGRVLECRQGIDGLLRTFDEAGIPSTDWLIAALEAAVMIADRDRALPLAARLASAASADFLGNPEQSCTSVGRVLGAAAALAGQLDQAVDYCRQAMGACERARFRPELALTRLQLAEVLSAKTAQLGNQGGPLREEALGHLDFAIEEFRAMKMQPSLERALRHKGLLRA
jgi:hypothetical protein